MNIRKHLPTAARLFLGLVFTVFGLNFFLHFIPTPPPPPRAGAFAGALFASGYLFPLLKTTATSGFRARSSSKTASPSMTGRKKSRMTRPICLLICW